MDSGPFRAQRPTDRRAAASRESAAPRQSVEPQPMEQPRPTPRTTTAHRNRSPHEEKSAKRFLMPVIGIIIVGALLVGGWLAWSKMQTASSTGIDSDKYQAVFFTNGQVYFGKLHNLNQQYLKLTDIYYIQKTDATTGDSSENPQKSSSDQADVQLIKLGQELHGPEDAMVINRDQVLFYENLKSDGKVAETIAKDKK
jgi:hypothetical protein